MSVVCMRRTTYPEDDALAGHHHPSQGKKDGPVEAWRCVRVGEQADKRSPGAGQAHTHPQPAARTEAQLRAHDRKAGGWHDHTEAAHDPDLVWVRAGDGVHRCQQAAQGGGQLSDEEGGAAGQGWVAAGVVSDQGDAWCTA